jgi:hypothetical protein
VPSPLPPRGPDWPAADRANEAIRQFWVLNVGRELTPVEWAEHDRLQAAWGRAHRALREAVGEEPARAA